jgi:hypothetical protein
MTGPMAVVGSEAETMAVAGTATRRHGGDRTIVVLGTGDGGGGNNDRAGGGGGLGGGDDGGGTARGLGRDKCSTDY